jgi:hypothetical protein
MKNDSTANGLCKANKVSLILPFQQLPCTGWGRGSIIRFIGAKQIGDTEHGL